MSAGLLPQHDSVVWTQSWKKISIIAEEDRVGRVKELLPQLFMAAVSLCWLNSSFKLLDDVVFFITFRETTHPCMLYKACGNISIRRDLISLTFGEQLKNPAESRHKWWWMMLRGKGDSLFL